MPDFSDDRLDASSLIVADLMEPVAAKNVGTGMFVIGATKVRPRVASCRWQADQFSSATRS